MNSNINEMVNYRSDRLFFYSRYSFLRDKKEEIIKKIIVPKILEISNKKNGLININVNGLEHLFSIEFLDWDSNYFNVPTYHLHSVLYLHDDYDVLKAAVRCFVKDFLSNKKIYCFFEVPSEDNRLIQAFNESNFKVVETRLTYYMPLNYHKRERYSVRQAQMADVKNLMKVAYEMRNIYDRFHSDPFYGDLKADEFLAKYAEESVKGFADYTIVPNEKNIPPDAFVTAKYLKHDWELIGNKVSEMVLSSVSAKTCKGWYIKLISEMAYHLQSIGAEYSVMHPASTNKAVIYTYEKLGCKLGGVSNVLTYSN
jgi:dTDP-4-amino-4,6-dideoxy-D-galactose acyltransferase